MKFSSRLRAQKNLHWITVAQLIQAKEAEGIKVLRMASGDPDLPTPPSIVERLRQTALDPIYHRYPFSFRTELNKAIATWYRNRFHVDVDPGSEVFSLTGSQAGIGNLGLAVLDPGDVALVVDPAYGSYARATEFAGGEVFYLPLAEENDYLPDLSAIPKDILDRARILWLNYPHNPTGAVAPMSFFEAAVDFARKNDILICHDNAYSDVGYDGYVAPSLLAVDGAKDVALELNTLSKAFNMSGWRVGMAVGNRDAVHALIRATSNTSMGLFGPIQLAAIEALTSDQSWLIERNKIYEKRRDLVVETFREMGLKTQCPKATLYVWARLPEGYHDSLAFSKMLLDRANVWISSGVFFGKGGEGFLRASLTLPTDDIQEAMERLKKITF